MLLLRLAAAASLALVACASGPSFEERQARDHAAYQERMAAWNTAKGEPAPIASDGSTLWSADEEQSGSVHVDGYRRADGTYVRPHTRSRPRR